MIYAISFTENGEKVASKLKNINNFDVTIFSFKELDISLKDWCKNAFEECEAIIFIGAVGIATRVIAPYIKSKTTDPAVIVIDEKSKFVIPILSGHIGGGNDLAKFIANSLGSTPVITTATDLNGLFAVDVFCKKNNLHISDMEIAKEISAKLLRGEQVGIYPNEYTNCIIPNELFLRTSGEIGIYIGEDEEFKPFTKTLNAVPKNLYVGVGMKKGTSFDDFEKAFLKFISHHKISINSIKAICSIDLKKDETAIKKFSDKYRIPTIFYSAVKLNSVWEEFSSSDFVQSVTGTNNVCERSCYLASGENELKVKKTIINHITFSLAQEKINICFL